MARTIRERLKHEQYPRLKIQLRARSRYYQAITFLDGRKAQHSLKTSDAETALKLGERWYKRVLRESQAQAKRHPLDKLTTEPTVAEVYADFRRTLPKAKRAYCDSEWGALIAFWRGIARAAGTSIQQLNDFYLKRLDATMGVRELTSSVVA